MSNYPQSRHRPTLKNAQCIEIRDLAARWPRKYTPTALGAEFHVRPDTIDAVLNGQYQTLEDYIDSQNVLCTKCGVSIHPSTAVYMTHHHTHSDKGYHCKACWQICNQTAPKVSKPRVYAYVAKPQANRILAFAPGQLFENVPIAKHQDFYPWRYAKRRTLKMVELRRDVWNTYESEGESKGKLQHQVRLNGGIIHGWEKRIVKFGDKYADQAKAPIDRVEAGEGWHLFARAEEYAKTNHMHAAAIAVAQLRGWITANA